MAVRRWPRRPGLDSEPVRVRFEVDRIASGQVFLQVLRSFLSL